VVRRCGAGATGKRDVIGGFSNRLWRHMGRRRGARTTGKRETAAIVVAAQWRAVIALAIKAAGT
jgi:hypothetical protein